MSETAIPVNPAKAFNTSLLDEQLRAALNGNYRAVSLKLDSNNITASSVIVVYNGTLSAGQLTTISDIIAAHNASGQSAEQQVEAQTQTDRAFAAALDIAGELSALDTIIANI